VSPDDDVVCRMRLGSLKVDFMPDDETILGFSNRWHAKDIETSVVQPLTDTPEIRRLTPPLLVATKKACRRTEHPAWNRLRNRWERLLRFHNPSGRQQLEWAFHVDVTIVTTRSIVQ
jgi:hypothetical protein